MMSGLRPGLRAIDRAGLPLVRSRTPGHTLPALGVVGHVLAVREAMRQFAELETMSGTVVLPAGSGGQPGLFVPGQSPEPELNQP
jgi:hypothetical protein